MNRRWKDDWRNTVNSRKEDGTWRNYDESASYWRCSARRGSLSSATDSTDIVPDDVRLTSHDMADSDPGFSRFVSGDIGSWLGTGGKAVHIKTRVSADMMCAMNQTYTKTAWNMMCWKIFRVIGNNLYINQRHSMGCGVYGPHQAALAKGGELANMFLKMHVQI